MKGFTLTEVLLASVLAAVVSILGFRVAQGLSRVAALEPPSDLLTAAERRAVEQFLVDMADLRPVSLGDVHSGVTDAASLIAQPRSPFGLSVGQGEWIEPRYVASSVVYRLDRSGRLMRYETQIDGDPSVSSTETKSAELVLMGVKAMGVGSGESWPRRPDQLFVYWLNPDREPAVLPVAGVRDASPAGIPLPQTAEVSDER